MTCKRISPSFTLTAHNQAPTTICNQYYIHNNKQCALFLLLNIYAHIIKRRARHIGKTSHNKRLFNKQYAHNNRYST